MHLNTLNTFGLLVFFLLMFCSPAFIIFPFLFLKNSFGGINNLFQLLTKVLALEFQRRKIPVCCGLLWSYLYFDANSTAPRAAA